MIRDFLREKFKKMLEEYFLIICDVVVILSTPSKYSMRFSDLFKNFTSFTFAMVQKNSKFCRSQLLYISTFGKQMDQYTYDYFRANLLYQKTRKVLIHKYNYICLKRGIEHGKLFFFSTDSRSSMPKDSSNDNQLYTNPRTV